MSKDKYPSTVSPQMEDTVLIILEILFCNTLSFENWGIFSDIPSFSWGTSGHVMCLDQSGASENI